MADVGELERMTADTAPLVWRGNRTPSGGNAAPAGSPCRRRFGVRSALAGRPCV